MNHFSINVNDGTLDVDLAEMYADRITDKISEEIFPR